ncbi:unnamed protein product [Brassica rapa subsp. trilocularis]
MSTPLRITTLNLSSSGLTGTIAAAIQNLTQLETMDLSNNNLTGGLPDFLGNMKSLSVINLSGNNLSGSIPQALQREGLKLLVEGNPKLCFSDSCIKPHKKKPVVPIVASVVSAAVVIAILVLFLIFKNKKSTVLQGFISLDCGLPVTEPSPYNELSTGLQFSSDAKFIQSGKIGKIQANLESQYLKPYTRLRYFPEGIRNCYNLPVENNRKYLIRARFVYGNYDDLNTYPQFDLHLGPNPWATIDLQEFVNGTVNEIIHTQTSNSLQICLVKTGKTTPMISALELRPLGNNSYNTESGSLNLFIRMYANKTDGLLRYPDDAYDRSWFNFLSTSWSQIFTTLEVSNDNNYAPPKKALATAAIPSNLSAPLTVSWTPEKHGDQYYLYSHFAEIQDLHANDTREFDVLWNGAVTIEAFVPSKLLIDTFMNKSPETCDGGKCSYQLIKTSKSTLPPLLNALEIYTVIQFPQSETDENDVVAIKDIETAYGLSRIKWQGDPCVPQMYAWDGLNCSYTAISTPPRITSLNLSSSGLTGTIAAGIQNLTLLQKLDLSNNKLTGAVPEFLVQMTSLVIINLRGNDLTGHVPQALQRNGLELLVEGNPRLCLSGSCTKDSKKKFPLIIVASVASVAIIVIVLVLVFVLKKKKPSSVEAAQLPPITPNIKPSIETKKRRFTYSEVMKMTNNFQTVVGEGGFGVVCHGTLNDSEQVAVKLLSQSSSQGYKHFKAEVDLLLRVHYTNLVNLVGYCDEGDHLALIYEFMPNGDLKQHLSGKRGGSIFKWGSRLQIALEAALGLEYLHVGCTPPIVHRDIKTTNILLDQQLKAKIADFGLSRSFPVGGETHVSTVVAGTPGYLDPEYYHTSRLGEKSDVYSFGIVLLEMITNQPVIDQSRERSHIAQWVGFELNRGDITRIIDPNLHRDYGSRSVWKALELAMSCVNPSSVNRPNMSQVANELKEKVFVVKTKNSSRRKLSTPSHTSVVSSGGLPCSYPFTIQSPFQLETVSNKRACDFANRRKFLVKLRGTREVNVFIYEELAKSAFGFLVTKTKNVMLGRCCQPLPCSLGEAEKVFIFRNMESYLGLLVLITPLAIIHIVQAQDQQAGFISLDCGLPPTEQSPYIDTNTRLNFSSDTTFIQSGKCGRIQANLTSRFLKPYRTLRYFPDGIKNCYNLNVDKGRKYLIRASFEYGNYDGRDIKPVFDLYLGPNLWMTIDFEPRVNGTRQEILHIPTSNSLQICLVKTGETTPLISALELRPMGNDSYIANPGSLRGLFWTYFSKSTSQLRWYSGDICDRIWVSYFQMDWTQISTTLDVVTPNRYAPPQDALQSAATPTNASSPLAFAWSSANPEAQYYVYAHFAELQDLQANETREFSVLLNGQHLYGPLTPSKLELITVVNQSPRSCGGGTCILQLIRTSKSTHPPLINAYEVYTAIQFPQSETDENDVSAIKSIVTSYELNRINWQGDPCVPQQLRWDAINCTSTVSTPPRITTLNLSSNGLTGTIAAAIQNLTHLEKLDFSNNSLTGGVPDFLGNMKLLSFINLSGNNLSGSLPQALQRKGLEVVVQGNPRLCLSDPCRKIPNKKALVPIVASISSAVIVIAILVLYFVLRKKRMTVEVVFFLYTGIQLPPRMSIDTLADSREPSFDQKSRRFTYSEVIQMTNNFQKVLGKGGFGVVYYGTVNGSEQVAVKVLSQFSTQGYKEFKAEVLLLIRVHHTNLVRLVGYCYEGDHFALIYEFLPNGNLKEHLAGKGGKPIINWGIRLQIALDAALGLEYLHIGCIPPMVHRDVKTTNILLDENFKAKLADFGLSKSFQVGEESHVSTVIAGTHGYLDPEAFSFFFPFSSSISISLCCCDFDFDISDEIGRIPTLLRRLFLNLSCNSFAGAIPSRFSSLVNLGTLDISHNKLVGNLNVLADLQNLVSLNISFNEFSGELPNVLADLQNRTEDSLSPPTQ